MPPETGLTAVAHVIQLAVAPVFLLTGVAGLLAVLTNRLARIIDRSRVADRAIRRGDKSELANPAQELRDLRRRFRTVNLAIALVTLCAFFICGVIAALFLGSFFEIDLSAGIGGIFIAAMLALIGGLIAFLREIRLATSSMPADIGN